MNKKKILFNAIFISMPIWVGFIFVGIMYIDELFFKYGELTGIFTIFLLGIPIVSMIPVIDNPSMDSGTKTLLVIAFYPIALLVLWVIIWGAGTSLGLMS